MPRNANRWTSMGGFLRSLVSSACAVADLKIGKSKSREEFSDWKALRAGLLVALRLDGAILQILKEQEISDLDTVSELREEDFVEMGISSEHALQVMRAVCAIKNVQSNIGS